MANSSGDEDGSAGHSCPEAAGYSETGHNPGEITINGQHLRVVQASAEEQAAIQQLLGSTPPNAAGGARRALNWGLVGTKLAGVLFLIGAVGAGLTCGLGHHSSQCVQHGPGQAQAHPAKESFAQDYHAKAAVPA